MKINTHFKDYLFLQLVVIIYGLSSVCAKLASSESFFSPKFIFWYGVEITILGTYAILWQQVIKKFDLSIAYANRATALLWSLVFATLIFNEAITLFNIIGVIVIMIGIMVVNKDE